MSTYDRVMRKCSKFYSRPKKEEVYNLHYTIAEFLIPRLELFLTNSSKIVDWEWHKKESHIYIERDIRNMVKKLKYIQNNCFKLDPTISKRCDRYAHEVFEKLGEIYFYLWY